MSNYLLVSLIVLGCVVVGVLYLWYTLTKKRLPENKLTNEAIVLMDELTSIVEKEVRVYITSLEGTIIKFSDIDDIIIEIFFIVKDAVSDHVLERINEINLAEIGEEFDIDDWIKNVVAQTVKKLLGNK